MRGQLELAGQGAEHVQPFHVLDELQRGLALVVAELLAGGELAQQLVDVQLVIPRLPVGSIPWILPPCCSASRLARHPLDSSQNRLCRSLQNT